MSASIDALNKAIDDLGNASHAMLDKIADETKKIDDSLKSDNTPDVDAATARIRSLADELKGKLGNLSSSASDAASSLPAQGSTAQDGSNGAIAAAGTGTAAGPGVLDTGAQTPLAGVPATPSGTDLPAAGTAVPATDFVVTETSVNQDTSGPAAAPGAEPAAVAGETPVNEQVQPQSPVQPAPAQTENTAANVDNAPTATPVETNAGASAQAGNVPDSDASTDASTARRGSRSK